MAWIESHQELARHPKTRKLARSLGGSVVAMIGHLHLLWWWALDFADDGSLARFNADDIADAVQWEGPADQLVAALVDAGFLDADENGSLSIHEWEQYAGRLLDQRRLHNKRATRNRTLYADLEVVHEVRDRDGDLCRYCGRTVDWKDRRGTGGGTYDHIDPEGENSPDNVVVSCRGCNAAKGRRTPAQAGMNLLPLKTRQVSGRKSAADLQPDLNSTGPDLTQPDRTGPDLAASPLRAGKPRSASVQPAAENAAGQSSETAETKTGDGGKLAPLYQAFADLGLRRPPTGGRGEARAAQSLLQDFGPSDIARCWAWMREHGSDWERSNLSFVTLRDRNRLANWLADHPAARPRPSPPTPRELTAQERRWNRALDELRLKTRPEDFRGWYEGTQLLECDVGRVVIGARSDHQRGWLDAKCRSPIAQALGVEPECIAFVNADELVGAQKGAD